MFCDDLGEWDGGEGGGRQGPKGLNICIHMLCIHIAGASLVAQLVKNLPTVQETQVQTLGQEDPLEKGMVSHSSVLAWRIPWTERWRATVQRVAESDTTE